MSGGLGTAGSSSGECCVCRIDCFLESLNKLRFICRCIVFICNIGRELSFAALGGYESVINVVARHGVWPGGVGETCEGRL